jgi:hypothetical protein
MVDERASKTGDSPFRSAGGPPAAMGGGQKLGLEFMEDHRYNHPDEDGIATML